ncbi:hypothetical protein [Paractinoplanes hotanensis]|uniref:Uncharacterized protein n=1 Tax=Paractinoplanes hotanensis TaxID=2906497 RepID=A0ABT0YE45_9ACTN|nr:hypothetical protein [Actinoplanes hotanensis]MCM4084316.1 hypothetical protein [Actinoplanes hotanensis]
MPNTTWLTRAARRGPATLCRIYNMIGVVGRARGVPGLSGGVEQWADTLAVWSTRLGFDTFAFWPVAEPRSQLELFAGEVIPAARERVAR